MPTRHTRTLAVYTATALRRSAHFENDEIAGLIVAEFCNGTPPGDKAASAYVLNPATLTFETFDTLDKALPYAQALQSCAITLDTRGIFYVYTYT